MKLTETEYKAKVDELGQLEQDLAKLHDKEKQAAALRVEIGSWFDKKLAAVGYTCEGFKFNCTIGPKGNESAMDGNPAIVKAIGQKTFLAIAKVTIKALEAATTTVIFNRLVTYDRTGARTVKTFAKAK